jgi:subtilisin family serine protease
MKRKLYLLTLAMIVSAAALLIESPRSRAQQSKFQYTQNPIPNKYIVVLKPEIAQEFTTSTAQSLAATYSGTVGFVYESALKCFSIQMTEADAIALSNDSSVDYVTEDGEVTLSGTQLNPPNWGLDRIDQRDLPLNNAYTYKPTGAGVHAYVIDSGIRPTHQDFHGRAFIAADFVGDGRNGNDCNGHGTHVAGIIGGSTYGVAKGVTLHAVRVIGCGNTGQISKFIMGIDWVRLNRISPAVVNLSLNAFGTNNALDQAVLNSINSGLTYVIAAGNENIDASNRSPGRVQAAITVSATDISDNRPVWANYGSVVDLFAPGDLITSAWWDSDTSQAILSGTSMAAPHVAGVAAQYLQLFPGASPTLIRNSIVGNATAGRVINPGPGSPNLLLYSNFLPLPPRATSTDFNGDLKTDLSVWRPDNGYWYTYFLSNNTWNLMQLGSQGDQIAPGDYDGDGKADHAVWRPSTSFWYIVNSSNGTQSSAYWGVSGDIPVNADYDGDAKTDVAVWRPSDGVWYIIQSSTGTPHYHQWGMSGDKPVAADYDGDGKADLAVWRPSTGTWCILQSSTGIERYENFGGASLNDVLVPSDYDGDGAADIAVWRPGSAATFWILQSSTGAAFAVQWGVTGDLPVVGDYDGDGKSDCAVFRPSTSVWWIFQSSTATPLGVQWGATGDVPIPSAYNRY